MAILLLFLAQHILTLWQTHPPAYGHQQVHRHPKLHVNFKLNMHLSGERLPNFRFSKGPGTQKMLRNTGVQSDTSCGKFQKTLSRMTCAPLGMPSLRAPWEHVSCCFSVLFTLNTYILFLGSTIQAKRKRQKPRAAPLRSLLSGRGFPGGAHGKESIWQFRRHKRHEFDPWVGKILWGRKWQPPPVFLLGESSWTEKPTVHGVAESQTQLSNGAHTQRIVFSGSLLREAVSPRLSSLTPTHHHHSS